MKEPAARPATQTPPAATDTPAIQPSPSPLVLPTSTASANLSTSNPFHRVRPDEGLPFSDVSGLLVDNNGWVWVSGNQGVYVYNQSRWKTLQTEAGGAFLGVDAVGRVWTLSSDGSQVIAFGGDERRAYATAQGWTSLPAKEYLSPGFGDGLANDANNRVWLATGLNEVRRFDPQTGGWRRFTASDLGFLPPQEEGYQGHFLTDVLLSNAGKIWVSDCVAQGELLYGMGIHYFDGQRWWEISSVKDDCIFDLEMDAQGRVWAGANNALLQYDPATGSWQRFALPDWSRHQFVLHVDLDPEGNPWVELLRSGAASIYGATARYHMLAGEWVLDYEPDTYSPSHIAFGPEGDTWLCAEGGVYHLANGEKEQIAQFTGRDCLIAVDHQGQVWVAIPSGRDAGVWWWKSPE
ncbi:MAG: hypothetical protein GYA17_12795 [Chloroflexi bacterium]|nr:hypothetical protein [Chloroflexota bacterium]